MGEPHRHRVALAERRLGEAARLFLRIGDRTYRGPAFQVMLAGRSLAVIAALRGDAISAARLYGACEAGVLSACRSAPIEGPDQEAALAVLEAALPREQYEAEKAIGAAMPPEDAFALADKIAADAMAADDIDPLSSDDPQRAATPR
jgi:hypothetical protein